MKQPGQPMPSCILGRCQCGGLIVLEVSQQSQQRGIRLESNRTKPIMNITFGRITSALLTSVVVRAAR